MIILESLDYYAWKIKINENLKSTITK